MNAMRQNRVQAAFVFSVIVGPLFYACNPLCEGQADAEKKS